MDVLLILVRDYGIWTYILLFLYCALKSGALPLFAGFAAQADVLDLYLVAVATFAGGYLGDEIRFAVARRYGESWTKNWHWLRKTVKTAKTLIARYGWAYVFLYRYPKGMRTIGALPMGFGKIAWHNFTVLNAASAILWTLILVGFGYLFGAQIENTVNDNWGIVSILLLFLMASGIIYAWYKANKIENGSARG